MSTEAMASTTPTAIENPRPIPAPGIYYDIPAEEYFSWDAVNASFLKNMAKCAAKARHAADFPDPPTPAMLQGSVCHTALFEPDKLATRYVVAGECGAMKNEGKGKCTNQGKLLSGGVWYCGVHSKVKGEMREWDELPKCADSEEGSGVAAAIVTENQISLAKSMAIRARWDNKIRELLVGAKFEVCIVWVDPVTELLCKARLDFYRPDDYIIGDLKTCEDASEEAFARDIGERGYDIQAAMYLDAASSLEGVLHERFIFIAQEKDPPNVAAAWNLKNEAVELGRDRYRNLLADVKWCKENNMWPGYHDHHLAPISVSRYFFETESKKIRSKRT